MSKISTFILVCPLKFTGHRVNDAGDLVFPDQDWDPKGEWMVALKDEIRHEQNGYRRDGRKFCVFCEEELLCRVSRGEPEFKE